MSSTEDLVAGPLGIGGGSRRSTWRPTSGRTRVRADGEAAPGDHPRALPPGADAGRDAGAPRPDRHGDLAAKAPEWRTVRLPPSPPLRSTSGPVQGRHLAAAEDAVEEQRDDGAVDQAVALGGLRGLAAGRPRPFRRNLSSACQVSGPTGTASPVPGPRFAVLRTPTAWSGPVRVTAPNAPLTAPLPREESL